MKTIGITSSNGQTEPRTYYNIGVYANKIDDEPEQEFHGESGDEIDKIIPLSIVMRYLHLHPVEKFETDARTDRFMKRDLGVILKAHNAAVDIPMRE